MHLTVIIAKKENKGIVFMLFSLDFAQVFEGGFLQKTFHFDGKEWQIKAG